MINLITDEEYIEQMRNHFNQVGRDEIIHKAIDLIDRSKIRDVQPIMVIQSPALLFGPRHDFEYIIGFDLNIRITCQWYQSASLMVPIMSIEMLKLISPIQRWFK